MVTKIVPGGYFRAVGRCAILAAVVSIAGAGTASAYLGDNFLEVPGVTGNWQGAQYKHWIRTETHYWKQEPGMVSAIRRNTRHNMVYAGPPAPRQGAGTLILALDKHDPAVPKLMDACLNKTSFPELSYAESSERVQSLSELGPRPADMPEYFEYKLKDAQLSDCPVDADAPEQAFVVSFNDIAWVNYHDAGEGKATTLEPSNVEPVKNSDKTKTFVVSWIAVANDVSDAQCPKMNVHPVDDDYFALMSKEDADKERAELAVKKADVSYQNGQMGRRGPHQLDVCQLPGIVADPGHFSPQTTVARGLNLDGNDGMSKPSASACGQHKNYVSEDGRTGIDNQLYTVMGCMSGYQGHKGFLMQYSNEQRHNGLVSILLEVSGIDNEKNDNSVDIRVFYSLDHVAKDASGKQLLGDYTFRLTDKPEYTHYFTKLHGRIVNGVIVTDPVKQLQMNLGLDPEVTLHNAAMRLQIMADGSLKGVIGGYQDWRKYMEINSNSNSENLFGFQCPGLYNSLKRAADGMKDPVTGQCNGISSAFDVEAVPAFIAPAQPKLADKSSKHRQVAQADLHDQKAP